MVHLAPTDGTAADSYELSANEADLAGANHCTAAHDAPAAPGNPAPLTSHQQAGASLPGCVQGPPTRAYSTGGFSIPKHPPIVPRDPESFQAVTYNRTAWSAAWSLLLATNAHVVLC